MHQEIIPLTGQNVTFENRQTFDSTRHTRHTLQNIVALICRLKLDGDTNCCLPWR